MRSKPWLIGIAIGLVLMMIVWEIYGSTPGAFEKPIISSPAQYNDVLAEAAKLSEQHLVNFDKGAPLTERDKVDLRHAALDFDALSDYQPNNLATYTGAGKIYQVLDNDDAAIKRFQQGLLVVPPNPMPAILDTAIETHYLFSVSLFKTRRYQEALNEVTVSIGYLPNSPIYLTQRASIYIQMGHTYYRQAARDLAQALTIDPSYKKASSLLRLLGISAEYAFRDSAQIKLNKRDYAGVVLDCTTGIKIVGNSPALLAFRSAAYIALGKKDLAKQDVDSILAIDPGSTDAQTLLKQLK